MVGRLERFFLEEKVLAMRGKKAFHAAEIDRLARSFHELEPAHSFARQRLSSALSFAHSSFHVRPQSVNVGMRTWDPK